MISQENRRLYAFLMLLARSEDYPPKDGPFQDYSYFPEVPLAGVRQAWQRTLGLMKEGKAPRELGLYVHWPFCPSQCVYCFCNMRVPENASEMAGYAAMLRREMDAFSDLFEGAAFTSVYFGGGTPTYIADAELEALLGHLRGRFTLAPDAQVYVEASPATLTDKKLDILLRHGVNRITLGVQSRDPAVLARINRAGQTPEAVDRAWALLAGRKGLVRDIDLVFGIDGQPQESFAKDLSWALRRAPDALHVYGFDAREQTLFAKAGHHLTEEDRRRQILLLEFTERLTRSHGYGPSRWEPEAGAGGAAEERQDGNLRRLGGSVLGLGFAAKSHAFGAAWYQHRPVGAGPLPADGLLPFYAVESDLEEEARGHCIRHLALYKRLSRRVFREGFGKDLPGFPAIWSGLQDLVEEGILQAGPEELRLREDSVRVKVLLKHLYGPAVLQHLLRTHRGAWEAFCREHTSESPTLYAALHDKAERRAMFRVYYRGQAQAARR